MNAPLRRSAWSTACPDWEKRLLDGRSLIPDLPLFDAPAEKALRIFKRLRVPDLPGKPTYGDVCEPWVFDFVRAIFGSLDPETMHRKIREFFLLVPKKNGKSAIAAAIIVTAAIMNERPSAECILIAPTQKIAEIAFKQARGIIEADPDLSGIFWIRGHQKRIVHRTTEAEIIVLSADGDVVTGSKAAYILVDETHVLAAKAKAPEIFTELRGGLASRPEGFMLQITTQSKSPPVGQFKAGLHRARAVRDGTLDLQLLPVLYELPEEMSRSEAWRDEGTWGLVNPNLERSVSLDYLQEAYRAAVEQGPEAVALFASQHLNVEIGLGLHSERWVGADFWAENVEPGLTLDALIEQSEVCVVGGDFGGADDLSAIAVIGRDAQSRVWRSWVRCWALNTVLDRRKEIAPHLLDFEAQGDLVLADTMDVQAVEAADIVSQIRDAGRLPIEHGVGLDSYGVAALEHELRQRGVMPPQYGYVGQGFRLNGAIKGLERRLVDGSLRPADQPLMSWNVSNAKAEQRGNNVMITKAKAGVGKIDALIALTNAAMLMDRDPYVAEASPWDRDPNFSLAF